MGAAECVLRTWTTARPWPPLLDRPAPPRPPSARATRRSHPPPSRAAPPGDRDRALACAAAAGRRHAAAHGGGRCSSGRGRRAGAVPVTLAARRRVGAGAEPAATARRRPPLPSFQETKAVFEKLHKYIGKNIRSLVDRPDDDHVLRLHRQRVYYVRASLMKRATNVGRDQLVHLGTCVGKLTHSGKFRLTVGAVDLLAQHAKYKVRGWGVGGREAPPPPPPSPPARPPPGMAHAHKYIQSSTRPAASARRAWRQPA